MDRRYGARRGLPEQPGGDRGGIRIDDDGVGFDPFAFGRLDGGHAVLRRDDFLRFGAVAKGHAVARCQCLQGFGELEHAAVDEPHAGLLDMGDKHQGRRRFIGR